jgi:heat shock protein HslJ
LQRRIDEDNRTEGLDLKFDLFAAAIVAVLAAIEPIAAADFPFDQEMLLDAKPLPGSKRVPILEIATNGRAQVDLWCRSGTAQVEVAGDAIKFTLGPLREEACTPERSERDEAMIAALAQVTQWRAEDDVVILHGPTELRFRLSTH